MSSCILVDSVSHIDSVSTDELLADRFVGDNVERFLMGRQVCVVFLVFFAAKLTTIYVEEGEDFLFPTPWWFKAIFLESGILGCIVLVIIAQLMPQIVAAKFPVREPSTPFTFHALRLSI